MTFSIFNRDEAKKKIRKKKIFVVYRTLRITIPSDEYLFTLST